MVSVIGPQPQTDHHRPLELSGEAVCVEHPQHNIRLLISRNSRRNNIKVPQELFRLLQFYYYNIRIRSCPQIAHAASQSAACRHPRHDAAMSVLVPAGNHAVGILRPKGTVNILSGIFRAVEQPLRRPAALVSLIPDGKNSAVALTVPKRHVRVIYPRVNDTDHHAPARQAQRGPLSLCYAAGNQAVGVKASACAARLHQTV